MDKSKANVPKIRFPGFTDPWKQHKLGDISDVTKLAGFEFTEYVTYSDEGTIIALRGLNVKGGKIILDDVKYIDQSDFSKLNRSKLFKNDILFTYVGTVGELAIIPEDNKYYLAPNVARIRLRKEIDPQFIIQMMGNKTYYDEVIFPLIATSSQPALSMENVRKFILKLPSFEEQTKIGEFFAQLDNLITLHQCKLNRLQDRKKSLLQKMFPKNSEDFPELRFPGFTDPWEQRKLSDGTSKIGDGLHGTPEFKDTGDVYFINGNNLVNGNIEITEETKRVSYIEQSDDDKTLDCNTILMSINGTIGNLAWYSGEKIMLGKSTAFIKIRDFNKKYIYYYLQTSAIHEYFFNNLTGTTIKNLGLKTIRETIIDVPSIGEQLKIGQFFEQLDNLITLNQRKLNHLKEQKKSLLQQMFA
ncbi:Type-1 restriction enzyme EcoKI specificity protein [Clostridium liquoris]|jgi:type I restriction enzyme S subunit|uniref:Type-1 restriction enzyme EcoKI specificity protein n=1 Tax=Clostridium liquoris TaxID=1289519 RepID=A0A2T0B2E9_9CLOT|nr:restriction endonuclease subunit S [Clostridium liquoris]PRR78055.1 Type-1 restriction enzyme EcoKI specificity protein [Clostridium liquoris]